MARLSPFVLLVALCLVPGLGATSVPGCGDNLCACPKPPGASNPTADCYNPNTQPYSCPPTGQSGDPNSGLKNPSNGDNRGANCPSGFAYSKGDPLVKGFDGCTWYLNGEAGTVMNLLTESKHVVNTLLVPANLTDEHHDGAGTFHGSISVRYQDTIVTSSVDTEGNLTVYLNEQMVPFEAVRERQGLTVKAARHFPYFGQIAEIVTPAFRFFIHAVQPYDSPAGWSRGHLDFSLATNSAPLTMHGLLGQGSGRGGQLCADDAKFHGDGTELDYVMPHLDSVDYKFTEFKNAQTTRRLQAASRVTYLSTSVELVAGSVGLA